MLTLNLHCRRRLWMRPMSMWTSTRGTRRLRSPLEPPPAVRFLLQQGISSGLQDSRRCGCGCIVGCPGAFNPQTNQPEGGGALLLLPSLQSALLLPFILTVPPSGSRGAKIGKGSSPSWPSRNLLRGTRARPEVRRASRSPFSKARSEGRGVFVSESAEPLGLPGALHLHLHLRLLICSCCNLCRITRLSMQ